MIQGIGRVAVIRMKTGGAPCALRRMWTGVVHPPQLRSGGGFFGRPILRYRCTRVYADDDAVRVVCSHTALAAFPGCCTDKNNKNSSLRREGREGILIVEWCTVGVKP